VSDLAIRVENLSKRYRIGRAQQRHDMLRDQLADAFLGSMRRFSSFVRRVSSNGNAAHVALHTSGHTGDEFIWALKDVSLEVKRGQVLGIIGRNGAGKSTLLKILSRVTEPTAGRAIINGRVGSLLEVGTGFHPELTGRENIYLNGALLGMKRAEIERKFDEIVAFAETEKFLETPVKRYSSGMYVRLAFAVAAHLEPEILLVDEVLAVGDAAFQKKCLGKMGDVTREGRTVLFVSHNMVAVQSLCQWAIWLHDGQIQMEGEPLQVVSGYLQSNASIQTERIWDDIETAPGNEVVRLHRVGVRPENGSPSDPITMETPFQIEIEFWNFEPGAHLHILLQLVTEQHIVAFGTASASDPKWRGRPYPSGLFKSVCHIPGHLLNSGAHRIALLVVKDGSRVIYQQDDLVSFDVLDLSERQGAWYGKRAGAVLPRLEWTTEYVER
jgi:lipopolysaccharide transport system ATP-binding protein